MVKMILCIDANGNIGRNGDLLFKMKEDMKFFRQQTQNSIVVMGYNTWLSLGEKPLPNRLNIVLTDKNIPNVETSNHIFKVIDKYEKDERDIFVIGGAFVYNECLRLKVVDEVLITVVPIEIADADAKVDLTLMEDFNKRSILQTFVNENGIKVTIEKWNK
jgi:dihydrofolate reductase